MNLLILIGSAFCGAVVIAQFASILMAILRVHKRDNCVADHAAGVSILRPVCGIENFIEQTLRSTFELDYQNYEIVFCVAEANDPVLPLIRRLIATHPDIEARLLTGDAKISANPKLNNLIKGWHAARYQWVLMADSNVLMPKDHLQRMLSVWRPDTGLVCSPPIAGAPENVWAELECAFLNTYQARWQYFADSVGLGFAQGKAMLWRRELLEAAGGIEVLGSEIAEDAAATKVVRSLGLRVRLVPHPFVQPLGYRSAADIWRRQLRWARLRRITFKQFFIPELFVGIVPSLAAAVAVTAAADMPMISTLVPLVVAWFAAEAYLARSAGWHFSRWSIPIWILRDALCPMLWIAAWLGDEFEWRGNAMSARNQCLGARVSFGNRSSNFLLFHGRQR